MSAIGGTAVVREKIGVELVLNLGEYIKAREIVDKDLLKAQADAEKSAKRREAFNKAVAAGFWATVNGLKKAYSEVSASIERIAKARGDDDPTVQAFRGMERAGKSAFDTFVRGALSSGTASAAMQEVTRSALALAESAKGVGTSIDDYVQRNGPNLVDIGTSIGGTFEMAKIAVSSLSGGFQTLGGVVSVVAGHIGYVLSQLGVGQDKAERITGKLAGAVPRDMVSDLERLSQALAAEGMKDIEEGAAASVKAWEDGTARIADAALAAGESVRSFVEKAKAESEKPKPREGGIILADVGRENAILAGMRQIATSVEQVFSGSAAAIADTLSALSAVARDAFDNAAAATLGAAGAAFGGLASFAAQAERAFGQSSAAAEVFARVQLGLQAVLAVVAGLDQMGKASAATVDNPAAVGPHKIAAGLYFASAGLAGGQAVGAFGSVGGGSSGGGVRRETTASTGVARREQKIEIVVQGNLLGNEEYVRSTVVPALKRLARDRDVEVTQAR
jgi:hypothetical protein